MASVPSLALAFPVLSFVLSLSTIGEAQGSETPHGLIYESPLSLSPSAVAFFHPKYTTPPPDDASKAPCADDMECSHLAALAASYKERAESTPDTEWSVPENGSGGVRAGNVVAIVLGLAFLALVAMGASYVLIKRRAGYGRKANPIEQPNA